MLQINVVGSMTKIANQLPDSFQTDGYFLPPEPFKTTQALVDGPRNKAESLRTNTCMCY